MHKILIQGGGEHARVVLDCLLSNGAGVVGLYDPKYSGELFGVPQCGAYKPDAHPDALTIIAIGDNAARKRVAEESNHRFTNTIHASAVISPFSKLGEGNAILHRAIVQAQAVIGNHVIINTGAQVDHDCVIKDYVHLAPGVILCGTVKIGEGAFVGAGSVIIPGKQVGAWATIGAGSVVISDIPDYAVAVGNPAKVTKYLKP